MRKEIEAMINTEEARYDINGVFSLRYHKHDALGVEVNALRLEFSPAGGGRYHQSADIQSRTASEILAEIAPIMEQMLDTYKEDMIRSVSGGNWGRLEVIE